MISQTLYPDTRGRLALKPYLIDDAQGYDVDVDETTGTITLSPVAMQLTVEQLADLRADPQGFVALLDRAREINDGRHVASVPVDDFFDQLDS